jgi:hypothetical protein
MPARSRRLQTTQADKLPVARAGPGGPGRQRASRDMLRRQSWGQDSELELEQLDLKFTVAGPGVWQ